MPVNFLGLCFIYLLISHDTIFIDPPPPLPSLPYSTTHYLFLLFFKPKALPNLPKFTANKWCYSYQHYCIHKNILNLFSFHNFFISFYVWQSWVLLVYTFLPVKFLLIFFFFFHLLTSYHVHIYISWLNASYTCQEAIKNKYTISCQQYYILSHLQDISHSLCCRPNKTHAI